MDNVEVETVKKKRASVFMDNRTRLRLNELKGEMSLEAGRPLSQGEVIDILMTCYRDRTSTRPVGHRRPASFA